MKKKFNKILSENVEYNSSGYNNYNKSMLNRMGYEKSDRDVLATRKYGRYNSPQINLVKDNEKVPSTPQTSEELEIARKVEDYEKKVTDLKNRYTLQTRDIIRKLNKDEREIASLTKMHIKKHEGESPKDENEKERWDRLNKKYESLESEINFLEDQLEKRGGHYEDALQKINDALEDDVKLKLKTSEKYVSSLKRSLDENFEKIIINSDEKSLIFGESFSIIRDVIALNEGTSMSIEAMKTMTNANASANSARKNAITTQNAYKKGAATASQAHSADMQAKKAEADSKTISANARHQITDNDPLTLEEDATEQLKRNIAYKEAGIEKLQLRKQDAVEQMDARIEAQRKQVDGLKQSLEVSQARDKMAKEAQKQTVRESQNINSDKEEIKNPEEEIASSISGKTSQAANTIENLKEERVTYSNYNDFTKMLFNGASGDALNYFINGTVNNKNMAEIAVANYMKSEKNDELDSVLKKIKYYLRRSASGLTYEQYIDLKVQKGKFKSLFTEAKKKYQNRYNINKK